MAAKAPFVFYLFVWLIAILVALPYFFAVSAEEVDNLEPWNSRKIDELLEICEMSRPEICLERTWHRLPISRKTYVVMVLFIQYFLPLAALGFSYSQIGSTIRKRVKYNTTVDHHRKQAMTQRNRKALLLLLMLVLIYALAWLPMNLYNVLNLFEFIDYSQHVYIFCHLIGMISTIANPILYALINDSFRSAFFNLLRPVLKPCTKYITVSPSQRNNTYTHTTYSFTLNQMGSPRRDFKINPDSSVPLINTPTTLPPQLTNGQEQMSSLLKVPYN